MWPTFAWPKMPFSVEVRRARPDRLWHPVVTQDEELVVHQLPVHAALTERLDVRRLDRGHVRFGRAHVVEDHVHLRPALMLSADGGERSRPLELVASAVHLPAGAGAPNERDERLEQPAREPLVRAGAGDVRRLVLEAARVLLRRHRPSVEEGRVHGAELRLGRDLDVDRDPLLQVRRVAVERDDRVGVRRSGLDAVVRPLKTLDRLVQCGELLAGGRMRLGLLERLQAAEPDRVALVVVEALEGEAEAAGALVLGEVQPEEDDVRSCDRVDGQSGVFLAAPH
jgi:hypothetical protein